MMPPGSNDEEVEDNIHYGVWERTVKERMTIRENSTAKTHNRLGLKKS